MREAIMREWTRAAEAKVTAQELRADNARLRAERNALLRERDRVPRLPAPS